MKVFPLILLLALVGCTEYEEALDEQAEYCQMVEEGYWPDYKNIYEEVCK